ncbi:hypothetical protein AVO42_08420 [Thiomicrospira sp. XS5]|uniref:phosphatidate cytidylyltransferase n=1 Tax=Thiomicrospira sp. XS5 TaxID=1775636 RepID=UPI000747C7A2|nr:phosphatidate cytidylyltransferase [Thiomicrospira sp. XS5]KUJ75344.1 hypothetical protein AVO42_08420 [Thiomicrospira sp. XS5]
MLMQRVITATLLFLLVGGLLFFANDQVWAFFILAATFLCGWEWSGFARVERPFSRILYGVIVALAAWGLYVVDSSLLWLWLTLVIMAVMATMVMIYQWTAGQYLLKSNVMILVLGVLILANFASILMVFLSMLSPAILLLSLFVVWAIDTGAYFAGRRFGRRKLAVHVSPGKTWEGVYGGALLAFVIAVVGLNWLQPDLSDSYLAVAVVFSGVALFSIFGDLFESLLKRQANLKDSSQLLPGHGGLLDRVDSLLVAVPMFFFVWQWMSV